MGYIKQKKISKILIIALMSDDNNNDHVYPILLMKGHYHRWSREVYGLQSSTENKYKSCNRSSALISAELLVVITNIFPYTCGNEQNITALPTVWEKSQYKPFKTCNWTFKKCMNVRWTLYYISNQIYTKLEHNW